jgi:hypothetical protein
MTRRSKNFNHKYVSCDTFRQAEQRAYEDIRRVLMNNKYLCKVNGISLKAQRDRFKTMGINITEGYFHALVRGSVKSCQMSYLQLYAVYWSIDLSVLMGEDFSLTGRYNKGMKQEPEQVSSLPAVGSGLTAYQHDTGTEQVQPIERYEPPSI